MHITWALFLLLVGNPLHAMDSACMQHTEGADNKQKILLALPADMWVEILCNIFCNTIKGASPKKFIHALARLRATSKNMYNYFSADFMGAILKAHYYSQKKLNNCLFKVVRKNDAGIIWLQALLHAGVDKGKYKDGFTPLHDAAF